MYVISTQEDNRIKNTRLYKELVRRESNFINQIEQVYDYATDMLPKINKVFESYTGHGIKHSLNVMEYMFNLIDDIEKLSELDITALIYVALLHDIGMVVSKDEVSKIKTDDLSVTDRKYSLVLDKYGDEEIALQECIRPIHGKRAKQHILGMEDKKLFNITDSTSISFIDEICNICVAHNENFEWVKGNLEQRKVKGSFELNSQYIAILLRLADLLDIDENRAPLYMYEHINPKGYGDLEWHQHFIIENKNKVLYNEKTGLRHIEFYGSSEKPKTHRKLLKYFDYINLKLPSLFYYQALKLKVLCLI